MYLGKKKKTGYVSSQVVLESALSLLWWIILELPLDYGRTDHSTTQQLLFKVNVLSIV